MSSSIYICGTAFKEISQGQTVADIENIICKELNLQKDDFYMLQNGKRITADTELLSQSVHVSLRLNGGKGGFGSMLRAIGAQIEKTTNREACRDLSGRRLRDINEEKRLKSWIDKQSERDKESEERKKRKLEKLTEVPKHEFKDSKYETARSDLAEKLNEAIEEGLKNTPAVASTSNIKRKGAETDCKSTKPKKGKLWIDDEISSSSDTDSDSECESKTKASVKQ